MPDGRHPARAIKAVAVLVAAACVWGVIWNSASAFWIVIVWGGIAMSVVAFVRRALRTRAAGAFREFWQVWSHDERYYKIRRFDFAVRTPLMFAFMVFMLVLQQWVLAALAGAVTIIGIVGILRTPWPRGDGTFKGQLRRWFG
jgi:hypothetical protein